MEPTGAKPQFLFKPAQVKKRVMALATIPSQNFYDLACELAKLYVAVPPSSLTEIGKICGISQRRLYYLVEVGQFVRNAKVDKGTAERLGWTKLSLIARHWASHPDLTINAISKLMALAEKSTAHNLPDVLTTASPSSKSDRAVLLRLSPEQYQSVEAALLAHGAKKQGRGLIGKEAAIVAMAKALGG